MPQSMKFSLAAAAVAALAVAGQAGAAVLIADNFDDVASGASLAGRVPASTLNGAAWIAPATNLTGNGTGGLSANSANGNTAGLNLGAGFFTANPGVYELSVDITQPSSSPSDQSWLGFGFAQGTSASNFTSLNTGDNLVNSRGAPWLLHRLNGAEIVFAGPGNTNTALSLPSGSVSTGVTHNFRLVLDTTGAQWTVNGFLDGVQQDLNGAAAGSTYTYAANPTDTHFVAIGTGLNGTGTVGTIDNFSFSGPVPVPEPAGVGLAFAAAALLAGRRRSRR